MKKTILILVIAVIVVGAAYYLYPRSGPAPQNEGISSQSTTTVSEAIAGWQFCNYPAFGFALSYPADWNITAGGNAEGTGGDISVVACGITQPLDILPDLIFTHSWQATGTTLGSMDLHIDDNINASIDAYLENNQYYAHKYPFISTTTINGYPAAILQGNRVVILTPGGTYTLTFGTSTTESTREDILQTFQFVPRPNQ